MGEDRLRQLSRTRALELLASVSLGRLVFTHHALPAIRPVNHLVECESIIVQATAGAAITSAAGRDGCSPLPTARPAAGALGLCGGIRPWCA